MFESMVHHIFSYFINNSEDKEIKAYIEYVQAASSLHPHNYMARFALTNFAMSYSEYSRPNMRILFKEHLNRFEEVDRLGTEIEQSKGIYVTPPCIDIPDNGADILIKNNDWSSLHLYLGRNNYLW